MPFDETSLWKIFECLVDGFTVLERGNEKTDDGPDPAPRRQMGDKKALKPWNSVIHFDLKPDNR